MIRGAAVPTQIKVQNVVEFELTPGDCMAASLVVLTCRRLFPARTDKNVKIPAAM
jgi:hypothetical protein